MKASLLLCVQDNYFERAYCLTALMTGIIMGGCGPTFRKSELVSAHKEFTDLIPNLIRFNLLP